MAFELRGLVLLLIPQEVAIEKVVVWVARLGNIKPILLAMRGCYYHYRWNEEYKATVLESRVNTTHLLAESIAALSHPPRAWVATSAEGTNNFIILVMLLFTRLLSC